MEEWQLRESLKRQRKRFAAPGPGCPDETVISAYVGLGLEENERRRVEKHIAGCDHCLSQIAFLVQAAEAGEMASLPADVLVRARELGAAQGRKPRVFGWRWTIATAATAVFAAVVGVSLLRQEAEIPGPKAPGAPAVIQPQPSSPEAVSKSEPSRKVRGSADTVAEPGLLSPREGESLAPGKVEFRWRPVRDALSYEVRLVTEEGSLIWEAQTNGNQLAPPGNAGLQPGRKYFVWVVAHLTGGRTVKSRAVVFQIQEPR